MKQLLQEKSESESEQEVSLAVDSERNSLWGLIHLPEFLHTNKIKDQLLKLKAYSQKFFEEYQADKYDHHKECQHAMK